VCRGQEGGEGRRKWQQEGGECEANRERGGRGGRLLSPEALKALQTSPAGTGKEPKLELYLIRKKKGTNVLRVGDGNSKFWAQNKKTGRGCW